jgi:hypothetical protein
MFYIIQENWRRYGWVNVHHSSNLAEAREELAGYLVEYPQGEFRILEGHDGGDYRAIV